MSGAIHAARAEPARDGDFLDLLDQENRVFSASRYVQTVAETPANVTVLSGEEIRRFGYRTVGDALKSLPGVYDAASQWPAIGVRGIAVPGDFGSRILTLINGMPIYEATYGSFFIEQLDLESIDRIEFIKGAGSALYGSGAVLGVINLITRSAGDTGRRTAAVQAASHRTGKLYGSIAGLGDGGISSFVSASRSHTGGRDIYLREFDTPEFDAADLHGMSIDNDRMDTTRLFGRASYQNAWLQGVYVDADKLDPLASYNSVLDGRLRLRETLGAIEAGNSHEFADGAVATARAYYFTVAEKGDYPYTFSGVRVPPGDYINVSDLSSRQYGAELRYDRFMGAGHHLLAGVEAKRVDTQQQVGDQPGLARSGVVTLDSQPGYQQWGMFLQDEMPLGDGKLFLGARYDVYSGFSDGVRSRVSPRVAYVRDLAPSTTAKLVYGEAYRAPTVYESLYQDGMPAAETLWANPGLKPEVARTMEALIEHQPRPGMKLRLSAFLTRLNDSPEQVVTPVLNGVACDLGPQSCIQYRNSGDAQQVKGIEGSMRLRQPELGALYGSFVLQHGSRDGHSLTSSPAQQAKFGVDRNLPWWRADAAIEAQFVGRMHGRMAGDETITADVPAYFVMNAALNIGALPDNWHLSLRADNLLDRTYYTVASRELQPLERVPSDGRRFSVQLQYDF